MISVMLQYHTNHATVYIVDMDNEEYFKTHKVYDIDNRALTEEDMHSVYLIDKIFQQSVFSWCDSSNVGYVIVVPPLRVDGLSSQDNRFAEEVDLYFKKLCIPARIMPAMYFVATNALLSTKSYFIKNDKVLLFYNIPNRCYIDTDHIYLLELTADGWTVKRQKNETGKSPRGTGDATRVLLDTLCAFGIPNLNDLKHVVICRISGSKELKNNKEKIDDYCPYTVFKTHMYKPRVSMPRRHTTQRDVDTIIYLTAIYLRRSTDWSCYVPVRLGNKLRLLSANDNEHCKVRGRTPLPFCFTFKNVKLTPGTEYLLSNADKIKSLGIAGNWGPLTVCLMGSLNGQVGCIIFAEKNCEKEVKLSWNAALFLQPLVHVLLKKTGVSGTFWHHGVPMEIVDPHGLESIPPQISFVGDKPVVGKAVTADMDPLLHNVFDLFDVDGVRTALTTWSDDFQYDDYGNLQVAVPFSEGVRFMYPVAVVAAFVNYVLDCHIEHVKTITKGHKEGCPFVDVNAERQCVKSCDGYSIVVDFNMSEKDSDTIYEIVRGEKCFY